MIVSVSWRNIWRNRLRSLVVIIAVTLGLVAGIFASGVMQGMVDQRIYNGINTEVSHIQIHNPKFLENKESEFLLENGSEIPGELNAISGVEAASCRTKVMAMLSSAETGAGAMVSGIIPEEEKQVTNIHTKLIEGNYFEEDRRNPIVISQKLADKLNLRIRSKVIITLQAMDDHLTGGAFRVVGIYKTSNSGFDEMNVFVKQDDINKLVGFAEGSCHEVAIKLADNDLTDQLTEQIAGLYPQQDVKSWKEIQSELGMTSAYMDQMLFIFMSIILLALAFGIINTMLMVVLERVKEIGMLMAIGMTRTRVFIMIMLETIFLSMTGALVGMGLGALVLAYFNKRGLDFSAFSEGFEAIGYDTVAYPYVEPGFYFILAMLVILTAILASIYPAVKALKLNPADAIRSE